MGLKWIKNNIYLLGIFLPFLAMLFAMEERKGMMRKILMKDMMGIIINSSEDLHSLNFILSIVIQISTAVYGKFVLKIQGYCNTQRCNQVHSDLYYILMKGGFI